MNLLTSWKFMYLGAFKCAQYYFQRNHDCAKLKMAMHEHLTKGNSFITLCINTVRNGAMMSKKKTPFHYCECQYQLGRKTF